MSPVVLSVDNVDHILEIGIAENNFFFLSLDKYNINKSYS